MSWTAREVPPPFFRSRRRNKMYNCAVSKTSLVSSYLQSDFISRWNRLSLKNGSRKLLNSCIRKQWTITNKDSQLVHLVLHQRNQLHSFTLLLCVDSESPLLTQGKVTSQSCELTHRQAQIQPHTLCLSEFLFSPKKARAEQDGRPESDEGGIGSPASGRLSVLWSGQ